MTIIVKSAQRRLHSFKSIDEQLNRILSSKISKTGFRQTMKI